MDQELMKRIDREIIADLYLSRAGAQFVEELVEQYGSRFGGSDQERAASVYIAERLASLGINSWREEFSCSGWIRGTTKLTMLAPMEREMECIALPNCPPGVIEAPLVFLGDGDPQTYEDNRDRLRGAIAMVSTATPRFYHRTMHRGEKLGRALDAGAIGFIWMRGEPGGLPETGSARFNRPCEVPAISVSFETAQEMLRAARKCEVRVRIESQCKVQPTHSYNVIGEIRGASKPEEIIVVGGHYDGHDISQSADDNGAGTAVVLEAAHALGPHKAHLARTIRFVAFAEEEMGLIGSESYLSDHGHENHVFMINLDGAGRGTRGVFSLQGWPEASSYFRRMLGGMHEGHVTVGDRISLYSDMYHFAAVGIPASSYTSAEPVSGGAPRGWGHTFWDTLDKINPRAIQMDGILIARILLRLATEETLPMKKKTSLDFAAKLREMGYDEILRYELRPVPGE